MNFSFLIDNSLCSSQITYSGLQVLDYAKNGVDYFVKKRIKVPDFKHDTFHLITSGRERNDMLVLLNFKKNKSIQSSWTHDIGHFFNTLKLIQPDFDCDLAVGIQTSFSNLNRYRFMNGADNLFGGLDCLKLDPGYVIIFTNCDDPQILKQVECNIIINNSYNKESHIPIRWDQRLIVMLLQPQGKEDYDFGLAKRNSDINHSFRFWDGIAKSIGIGYCCSITSLEGILEALDEIQAQPQVTLKLEFTSDPISLKNIMSDRLVERITVDRKDLLNKIKVRSLTKQNPNFVSQKHKPQINMTIFSRVYLPDDYPIEINENTNEFNGIPLYQIDLSLLIKEPLPLNIPIQDLHIENNILLEYFQKLSLNLKQSTLRFPILFDQTLYGLLCYSNNSIDMLFTVPNYPILSSKIEQIKSNVNPKQIDRELTAYFRQTPNYYNPCIKRLFCDHRIDSKPWSYNVDEAVQNVYMGSVKAIQTRVLNDKKKSDELYMKQKQLHQAKKSTCCAIYSENYETVMAKQCLSQQFIVDKRSIQLLIPYNQCKSSYPPFIQNFTKTIRNRYLGEDEIEVRYEPAFCGNPWKLFKKLYKDGMEIKQGHENYDIFNEDLMLTKVESQNTLNRIKNVKNKRKGFIFLENIQKWAANHSHSKKVNEDARTTPLHKALLMQGPVVVKAKVTEAPPQQQITFIAISPYESDQSINFLNLEYVSRYNILSPNNNDVIQQSETYEELINMVVSGTDYEQLLTYIQKNLILSNLQDKAFEIINCLKY